MTEPINRKADVRELCDAQGTADGAEGTPTPEQCAVIKRYLSLRDVQLLAGHQSIDTTQR
jgi:hypothetical protein